jgi:hypothetical protein
MTAAAPPRAEQSSAHQDHRLSGILLRIRITDLLVIIWAVLGAIIIRFGSAAAASPEPEYITFIVMLVATWVLMLHLHDVYDRRLLGHGPEEYKVVAKASFQLFAVLAIVSYLLRLEVARGFVAIAMPAGMLDHSLSADARAAAPARGHLVDHQSVTFAVWLGIAVLALVWASISLWHTRRVLTRLQQNDCVTQIRLASTQVAQSTHSGAAS